MAKRQNQASSLGSLAFLFGALIAILVGVVTPNTSASGFPTTTLTSLLILLGIVVGFLNVTRRETQLFLLASVSLIIVSALGGAVLGQVRLIGNYLEGILVSILTFVIPAAIIVALKTVYSLEEN